MLKSYFYMPCGVIYSTAEGQTLAKESTI